MTIIYRQYQTDLRHLHHGSGQAVDGILNDVGQGLTQQTGITHHHSPVRFRIKIGVEIHLLGFVQGNLTMRQLGKRQFFHHRLRHAGKIGKFINHAADIIDLTPDDGQILAELLAFCLVLRPVFTPQPVRRQLDRGKRILDLMRDATGHIRPCRLALRGQQVGHILERDDIADYTPINPFGRDTGAKGQARPVPLKHDLLLGKPAAARCACGDQPGKFRHNIGELSPDHVTIGKRQKLAGTVVRQGHLLVAIHTDHAG